MKRPRYGNSWSNASTTTRAPLKVLVLAALFTLIAGSAAAEICRPWCVHYAGGRGGGTNCGFISREQCMWTAQGADVCLPNAACLPSSTNGSRQGYGARERRR